MRPFFKKTVLERQLFKPMTIVIDTTKAGSASNTFVLPIIKSTTESVKIYWGDGTNSTGVNGNNTHVYAASGVYTVKIESKIFGGIYFNNGGDKAKITKVVSFGHGVIRLLATSFYGCSSLLSIDIGNIVSKGASTQAMFAYCAALTTVPLLNLSSVTITRSMFYQCTALTTVPLLNLSSVTDAYAMFYQCTSLTTVPLLNLSSVTTTQSMFYQCTALTTVPLLNLSSVTDASNMFLGVTLTTQSYSDFLINLATLPLKSGVSFHGGNSKYNPAAAIARAYLVSNFGWTITDGGAA